MPINVTFLGATTLLIDDGDTRLLTDGFFTRPGLLSVLLGKINPLPERISAGLSQAGVNRLDAVLVGHSHYDHAMDAPEVCRQTGACLYGSESTTNIARGWGLPPGQTCVIQPGQAQSLGNFRVVFIPSRHAIPLHYPGVIDEPLVPPARAGAYREGGTYAIWIEHPSGSLVIHESASFLPGEMVGVSAGAAFISVANLSRRPEEREAYFREVVLAASARLVCPLHHDFFFTPMRPNPILLPGVRGALGWLVKRVSQEPGMQFHLLEPWKAFELPGY
jgi:L-ascorbate metabolism protein UlaG (beta-lactamase superfamily)